MADLTNTYMGLSSFDFTGGFNILGKPEALDSRVTVSNISYIYEPTHWSFTDKNGKTRTILPYAGLIVGDHSGKAMICVNADQTVVTESGVQKPKYCLKSSWKEIGGAALIAATAADFTALTITENIGKTLYVSTTINVTAGDKTTEYSSGLYVIVGVGTVNKLEATASGGVDLASLSAEINTLKGDESQEGSVKYIAKGYADVAYSYAGEAHTKADEAKAAINSLNITDGKVADADNYVSFTYTQTNGLIGISGLTVSGLATTAYADSLGAKIDILVGAYEGDNTKSVRTIAADEVSKIVAGADTSYDTLKEIADWIAAHPQDVAAMNTRISNIETSYAAADALLSGRISTLENAGYVTSTSLDTTLSSYATTASISANYVTYSYLDEWHYTYAEVDDKLKNKANSSEVYSRTEIDTTLSSYATIEWVGQQGYLTNNDLSAYATIEWVGQQGYITPNYLSENSYVTSQWVMQQGFLTAEPDLSPYATIEWVNEEIGKIEHPKNLSEFTNDCGYITINDVPQYVHPDYSTTYAAYSASYTLESLGAQIDENSRVSGEALTQLDGRVNAVETFVSEHSHSAYDEHIANADIHVTTADKEKWNAVDTLLAKINELEDKLALYDAKFGYVTSGENAGTFNYEYLRIDDYEEPVTE